MLKNNNSFSLKIIFLNLGFLFFPVFFTSIMYLFNVNIQSWFLLVSWFLLIFLYFILFFNKERKLEFLIPLIISIIMQIIFLFATSIFIDSSYDGWGYHIPAMIELKNGWNPLYEHMQFLDNSVKVWFHYPKFIWIYGANWYKLTGNLFIGMSLKFNVVVSIFFLLYDILKKMNYPFVLAIIVSFIVSFDTVSIAQFFSYYHDAILGSCIWGLLLIFYAISKKIYSIKNLPLVLIITFLSAMLANIKFTGALFTFLIIVGYFVYLLITKKILLDKSIITSYIVIILGILIVSSNTYLANLIYHKNIGYPIIGSNKVDVITQQVPKMLKNSSKIGSFVKSLTFDSSIDVFNNNVKYKYYPFYLVTESNLSATVTPDCRMNGFGPFYQSIVILFLLVLVIKIIKMNKNRCLMIKIKSHIDELIVIFFILIIFFITPSVWWARYVSFMYALPGIILVMFKKEWNMANFETIFSYFMFFIYIVSSCVCFYKKIYTNYLYSSSINNSLNEIVDDYNNETLHIEIINSEILGYRQLVIEELLSNEGIDYKIEHEGSTSCYIKKTYSFGINTLTCKENNDRILQDNIIN